VTRYAERSPARNSQLLILAKLTFLISLLAAVAESANAQIALPGPGIINTVAGDGVQGYSGDGGLATNAKLSVPSSVAVDSSGNIYFADYGNERIRKVTATTGDISTVAGNGTQGYSGDGGPAVNAELDEPLGVAVDSSGNIYFADEGNYRIREVKASSGYIYTVAGDGTPGYSGDGGPATSAELYCPAGVAVDTSDNIYFGDICTHRVREVTASTGIIATVAGNGIAGYSGDGGAATGAELDTPFGVAVDASFNIYIGDYAENRVRKVTASTGDISTAAGDGILGYSGDGGAATSAELDDPYGVVVDIAGNIYIADRGNSRIREVIASTGIISTVAGDGTAGYSGDGGAATSAEINNPEGVAVDAPGNIYIADTSNNRIRAVAPDFILTGSMNQARWEHTATLLESGLVLVAGGGNAGLSSAELYNPAAGTFTLTGSMNVKRRFGAATLLPSGLVLIVGGSNNSIGGSALASAELYNPATGTFTLTGSMSVGRSQPTATLLQSGLVLVAGGGIPANASAELYDPATGNFTLTGSMNTARSGQTATLLQSGSVLIAGGGDNGALASAELYDTATGTFAYTGSMNAARAAQTATLLPSGSVLVVGGTSSSLGSALASAELYNPATGAFILTGSLNTAREAHTATLLPNGSILIAGGLGNSSGDSVLASAELYSPAAGIFTLTGSMNVARYDHTATLLQDGLVLITGGKNSPVLASAELYR
jgi:sugar lactone lactonase YvrE